MQKGDFVHFIGIGGVSMSGVAIELAKLGVCVSGSDSTLIKDNIYLQEIQNFGHIKIFEGGHRESNLEEKCKFIVITSTVREDNPELQKAKELGIKVLQRFEAINLILKNYKNKIGIFGGAGKTTTTALAFFLFQNAGLLPSLFLGSVMKNLMSSVHLNKHKDYCIFETDESDATFEQMDMNGGIFVAMESDHLEHKAYNGSFENMKSRFANLLLRLKNQNSPICYNMDSEITLDIVEQNIQKHTNLKSFSIKNKQADFYSNNFQFVYGGMKFDLYHEGELFLDGIFLPLAGDFNVLNVTGAIAMLSCFVSRDVLCSAILGLKNFEGIDKRQSTVGRFKNFDIIDDYAHSPLKISSMLEGFKHYADAIDAEVVTVCEVHKISRFKNMYQSFLTSFSGAKLLILIDIYKVPGYASEEPDMMKFIEDIKKHNKESEIIYIPNRYLAKGICEILKRENFTTKQNNFLIFLGAGNSSKIAKSIQRELLSLEG